MKLDFPRFKEDEDPTGWLCKAEQFFQFHETLDEERVSIAFFYLEGKAQMWFQLLREDTLEVSWNDLFKEGLHVRYGPNQYTDFFREITKL